MYRGVILIFIFFSTQATAQQHWLKGILLDKNTGESIAGAAIFSRADTVVSNADGRFSIGTQEGALQLKITHPGYQTMKLAPEAGHGFLPVFIAPVQSVFSQKAVRPAENAPDSAFLDGEIQAYRNETYKKEKENPLIETDQYPYTAFTLNGGYAAYNNVRRFLSKGKKVPVAAVRIGEMLNYFSFDDSLPVGYQGQSLKAYADFSSCPWNAEHWLMRVAVQSEKELDQSMKPWNIVLLIDVSGSMNSPDKLPLLRVAFKQLIAHLRPEDTLSIITYTGKTSVALPPTSGSEKLKMLDVIDHLHAEGTTAGSKGIKKAFELAREHYIAHGNNRVILSTDGDFNVGKSTDQEMKKLITQYRDWHIGLTCIGVGSGNYKDSKLETLAEWGQGTFSYIDNNAEALRIFNKRAFRKMAVIARDVRLKVLFDPTRIRAFRLLGYDSDGKNARYAFEKKKQRLGGEIGADQRMTAYIEVIPVRAQEDIAASNPPVTLMLQYKSMPERKGCLQVYHSSTKVVPFERKNADWRLGASVVLFGMLLQDSDYSAMGTYKMVEHIGKKARAAITEENYKNYRKLLKAGRKITK